MAITAGDPAEQPEHSFSIIAAFAVNLFFLSALEENSALSQVLLSPST
jgi:hypothetical protein